MVIGCGRSCACSSQSTPLLVAASAGSLGCMKTLARLGANLLRADTDANNVIQLAALHLHTNVLEHFMQERFAELHVWSILVAMLASGNHIRRRAAAVKCLEVLTFKFEDAWRELLDAGGVKQLLQQLALARLYCALVRRGAELSADSSAVSVGADSEVDNDAFRQNLNEQNLLTPQALDHLVTVLTPAAPRSSIDGERGGSAHSPARRRRLAAINELLNKHPVIADFYSLKLDTTSHMVELLRVAGSVLCNLSSHEEVRVELTRCDAAPVLIYLLDNVRDDEVCSKSVVVLADMACQTGNQELVAAADGLRPIVDIVQRSENEEVLVNAVNCLRILVSHNKPNQDALIKFESIIYDLIGFLSISSGTSYESVLVRNLYILIDTR